MTQVSYLWDGTVTGDASEAPYDKAEFNTFMFMLNSTDNTANEAYVSPNYLNDLRVYSTNTGMYVTVDTGAALVGGRYAFILDEAVSLPIDSIGADGYFRYDYIVLRVRKNEQTIRLDVIKGGETGSEYALYDPILVQTDTIIEIPIAKVYVSSEYNYVPDKYIYDMRQFATNTYTVNSYLQNSANLVKNSEFMVIDDPTAIVISISGWNTPATGVDTRLSKMSRGQSAQIDPSVYGVGTEYPLKQPILIDSDDRTFTVKGILKDVTGGGDGYVFVELVPCTIYGDELSGTYKRQEYTTQIPNTEIEFQFTVTLDDNAAMRGVLLKCGTFDNVIDIGQIIVVPGYFPGPFREISETIMFREPLTAVAWSDTAKSTGTTLVSLAASFGIFERTRGAYIRLRGRDSGSAGGVASMHVLGYAAPYNTIYGGFDLDGITNSVYREVTVYVPTNAPLANAQDGTPLIRIDVVATGAGTFDATAEIVGIRT